MLAANQIAKNKTFETLQNNVKIFMEGFATKNDLAKSLMEIQSAILEFVSSVQKIGPESGILHQEQACFYQQKHSNLLGKSQQQQQQQ